MFLQFDHQTFYVKRLPKEEVIKLKYFLTIVLLYIKYRNNTHIYNLFLISNMIVSGTVPSYNILYLNLLLPYSDARPSPRKDFQNKIQISTCSIYGSWNSDRKHVCNPFALEPLFL